MINPKSKTLNPKQYQNLKSKILNVLNLVLMVYLGFGIWGLEFTALAVAQTKTLKNIGFIQDNIWYSRDPFFESDKIRIYTNVFNGSQYDFKGTLEFFIGGKSLNKSNFSLISGAFQVFWADWTAESGGKKIYAKITEAKISLPGGVEEAVTLENAKTGEIETFVDKDTDKDGVGDKNDPKDDRIKEEKKETKEIKQKTSEVSDLPKSSSLNGGSISSLVPSSKEAVSLVQESVSNLNNFLDQQKKKAIAKKEELQKKLGEGESVFEFVRQVANGNLFGGKEALTEVGVAAPFDNDAAKNKNLLKLYILALSSLIFSIEYKAIIYLFGIYIAYRILKFFFKKLFFRKSFE